MPRNYTDKSLWNVPFALNNINVPTIGAVSTIFSGLPSVPTFGSQDDTGKRVALTLSEIANFTYTPNGTLYEGVYELVQLDPAATAANVGTGLSAFWLFSPTSNSWTVTDEAHAPAKSAFAGTFLNSVTPGNYCAIFVGGGRVNVKYKAALTNGAPAVGDSINVGGLTGFYDDGSATAVTNLTYGVATVLPVAAATTAVYVKDVITRI